MQHLAINLRVFQNLTIEKIMSKSNKCTIQIIVNRKNSIGYHWICYKCIKAKRSELQLRDNRWVEFNQSEAVLMDLSLNK